MQIPVKGVQRDFGWRPGRRRTSLQSARILVALLLASTACTRPPAEPPTESVELLSENYSIDRIYKSMQGPSGVQQPLLSDQRRPSLLWLTGFQATIVGEDGETRRSQEFMCHSNLDLNHTMRSRFLGTPLPTAGVGATRIATISQGLYGLRLPEGFGFPLPSIQPLLLTNQVLNHNLSGTELVSPLQVRHKIKIDYVRDEDLTTPMKPLLAKAVGVMVTLDEEAAYLETLEATHIQEGSSCSPGDAAMAGGTVFTDSHGQEFTPHWVVKPGREVRHTLVTQPLGLVADTRIHYIAVHLHPFAESLTLRDLTDQKDLFTSHARNYPDKVGLESVDSLSSEEGVPLYKDHEYQLTAVYNNTTDQDQDAMAVMYLFLADPVFRRERALEVLAELDQVIANMDAPTYQKWVEGVRVASVPLPPSDGGQTTAP